MFAAKAASTRLSPSTARSSSGESSCEWSQSSGRVLTRLTIENAFVLAGTRLPPSSRILRRSAPSPTSTSTPFRSRATRNPMYRSTRASPSYKLAFRVPSTWACRRCWTMKLESGKTPPGWLTIGAAKLTTRSIRPDSPRRLGSLLLLNNLDTIRFRGRDGPETAGSTWARSSRLPTRGTQRSSKRCKPASKSSKVRILVSDISYKRNILKRNHPAYSLARGERSFAARLGALDSLPLPLGRDHGAVPSHQHSLRDLLWDLAADARLRGGSRTARGGCMARQAGRRRPRLARSSCARL